MIDQGETYSDQWEVKDTAGVLTNPTTSACTLTLPDGTTVAPSLASPGTGLLRLDYLTSQEGLHRGAVTVTIAGQTKVQPFAFNVAPALGEAIISLKDAKDHLNITGTADDEELRAMIDAASEWIEGKVGPVVRQEITEDVVPASGLLFLQGPVISVTSMTDTYGYGYTYDVADFFPDAAGIVRPNAYVTYPTYPVTVTYIAGRTVVPASIRTACKLYLKALWETQRGATDLPIQGFSDDVDRGDGMGLAVWRAEKLLEPYMLPPAVA